MLRQLMRTGVAGARSVGQALVGPASLAAASAVPTVVVVPASDFSGRPGMPKKKKGKTRPVVNMHKLREERAKRFLADDESYVEPRPNLLGEALIHGVTILERTPVVVPKIPDWELIWLEREDALQERKSVDLPTSVKKDIWGKNTYTTNLPRIEFLPNYTEDDASDNRHSVYRKIDRPLYLIVKVRQDFDKSLPAEIWQFPHGEWRTGETLRKTAERGLFFSMGDIHSYYLGNAPICALERAATDAHRKEFPAAKTVKSFYHHALYLGGKIELEPEDGFLDYAWVAKEELAEYFTTPVTAPLVPLAESVLYYDIDSDPAEFPRPIPRDPAFHQERLATVDEYVSDDDDANFA